MSVPCIGEFSAIGVKVTNIYTDSSESTKFT